VANPSEAQKRQKGKVLKTPKRSDKHNTLKICASVANPSEAQKRQKAKVLKTPKRSDKHNTLKICASVANPSEAQNPKNNSSIRGKKTKRSALLPNQNNYQLLIIQQTHTYCINTRKKEISSSNTNNKKPYNYS
jgi:hypothetical protein